MPSSEAILSGLGTIANDWRALAIVWHVLLGTLGVALLVGWRPSDRLIACLVAAPVASVSVLAWASGNPFNGTACAGLVVLLICGAPLLSGNPVRFAPPVLSAAGALLVLYGSAYPHFLLTESWNTYLYAAPFGLLPCPTLSVVIGIMVMLDMCRRTLWSNALITAGIAYGVIGVVKLGVVLDYGLLAGALFAGVVAVGSDRTQSCDVRVAQL